MGQSQGPGGGQAETQNLCSCFQFAACWSAWGAVRMVASTSLSFSVHPCCVLGLFSSQSVSLSRLRFFKNLSHRTKEILGYWVPLTPRFLLVCTGLSLTLAGAGR